MPALRSAAPVEAKAYSTFSAAVMSRKDGAVPLKTRELIAIGVALTTQCKACLKSHVAAAKQAGATEEEIAETTFVASALRAGAAYTHGFTAMRCFHEDD
ncbi:carboxymuconolactone decarboxylase family protein [Prauserella cavernicola]|uniref:Carboxymuconolactone decarboxylase family protein n=1 Tax=Prauserella cavernicola TaxID=2800127 RepID=A0A934QUM1_9PSEU|nr:carboxymuconolactone decarboxylase family protein [Prauserella cavernicola]MBK1786633.1 carboxymuconolactone decarboxylase family protein [Prauserella cavernicola]